MNFQDLMTVNQVVRENPTLTSGAVRWMIFNSTSNGMDKCLVRIGRRVYINRPAFNQWLEEQGRDSAASGAKVKQIINVGGNIRKDDIPGILKAAKDGALNALADTPNKQSNQENSLLRLKEKRFRDKGGFYIGSLALIKNDIPISLDGWTFIDGIPDSLSAGINQMVIERFSAMLLPHPDENNNSIFSAFLWVTSSGQASVEVSAEIQDTEIVASASFDLEPALLEAAREMAPEDRVQFKEMLQRVLSNC